MSALTRNSAWTIFNVVLGAIRPWANCVVKKIVAISVISIFFVVMAAAVFSDHSGGHHGRSANCIFSASSVAPCPKEATAAANALFHINAMKQFFLAATELTPLIISALFAAAVIFGSFVFRRFYRSIYDAFLQILENLFTQKKNLRLQAIVLRHPPRLEFLSWLARSRAADNQKR